MRLRGRRRAPEKSKIFWERGAIARKSAALLSRQGARKGHIATTAKLLSKCGMLFRTSNTIYGIIPRFPQKINVYPCQYFRVRLKAIKKDYNTIDFLIQE